MKLSAVDGAEVAQAKVDQAIAEADPDVREAVDRAFDETKISIQALEEPWTLTHFMGDAYVLRNRSGEPAYDVEIDTKDFIARGEQMTPRVGRHYGEVVLANGAAEPGRSTSCSCRPGQGRTVEWAVHR